MKSRIRARIEHVFGAQEGTPGGRLVRTIGMVRAPLKIGLHNFEASPPRFLFFWLPEACRGTASSRSVTTNTHNHVEVGFVLIRAFDEPGLLDVLPMNTIVGRSHDFASDKFRKAMRYRVGGKHGSLLAHHYDGEPQEQAQALSWSAS